MQLPFRIPVITRIIIAATAATPPPPRLQAAAHRPCFSTQNGLPLDSFHFHHHHFHTQGNINSKTVITAVAAYSPSFSVWFLFAVAPSFPSSPFSLSRLSRIFLLIVLDPVGVVFCSHWTTHRRSTTVAFKIWSECNRFACWLFERKMKFNFDRTGRSGARSSRGDGPLELDLRNESRAAY